MSPTVFEIWQSFRHWKTWRNLLVQGAIFALITLGLIMLVAVLFRTYWNDPPVHLERVQTDVVNHVCPGDLILIRKRVIISEPTIALLYIYVTDEDETRVVPGTPVEFIQLPHSRETSYVFEKMWEVPLLEPGKYKRGVAARGHDTDEDVAFILVPFTVKENCNERRSSSRSPMGRWLDHSDRPNS